MASTVFDATAAAAEDAAAPGREPFVFDWAGTRYEVAHALSLATRQLQRFYALDETNPGQALEYLAELWPKDAYEALMDMPINITGRTMRAWLKHGDGAGKKSARSSTSSPTPPATKRRKRT